MKRIKKTETKPSTSDVGVQRLFYLNLKTRGGRI